MDFWEAYSESAMQRHYIFSTLKWAMNAQQEAHTLYPKNDLEGLL